MPGEAFVAASLRGEAPAHHGNRSPRFAPAGRATACARRRPVDRASPSAPTRVGARWRTSSAPPTSAGAHVRRAPGPPRRARRGDRRLDAPASMPQAAMEALQAAGVPAGARARQRRHPRRPPPPRPRLLGASSRTRGCTPGSSRIASGGFAEANPHAAPPRAALRRAQPRDPRRVCSALAKPSSPRSKRTASSATRPTAPARASAPAASRNPSRWRRRSPPPVARQSTAGR